MFVASRAAHSSEWAVLCATSEKKIKKKCKKKKRRTSALIVSNSWFTVQPLKSHISFQPIIEFYRLPGLDGAPVPSTRTENTQWCKSLEYLLGDEQKKKVLTKHVLNV